MISLDPVRNYKCNYDNIFQFCQIIIDFREVSNCYVFRDEKHVDQLNIVIFQSYVGPGAPTTLNPTLIIRN
jgi:hypothetical protein